MDPNFSFQLNLAGVQAAGGGKSLEEGYYKGTFADAYTAYRRPSDRHRVAYTAGRRQTDGGDIYTYGGA